MEWFLKVVKENYANFTGRARRAEYWNFILWQYILLIPFYILYFIFLTQDNAGLGFVFLGIIMLIALILFVPGLAVAVRRLHDIGKSGWFYLIGFIPIVGTIILLVWFCTDSIAEENEWGPDPKAGEPGH